MGLEDMMKIMNRKVMTTHYHMLDGPKKEILNLCLMQLVENLLGLQI